MRRVSLDAKTNAASDCLTRWTMGGVVNPHDLVSAGQRLEQWVESTYPGSTWLTEVPVNAPRAAGGQWVGSIDLLLLTPQGNAVIVDHKSWQGEPGRLAAKAQEFAPQISAYAEALAACGTNVEAGWLHFPLVGTMARVGLAACGR